MAEWKKVIVSGSNAELLSVTASVVTIGTAEDGVYTDGLYTDFTNMTPVGTAVDRFNEILKGLSPPPAPDLSNLESTKSTGVNNLRLAFGSSQSTASFNNVTGTGSLTAVDFKGTYTRETGPGTAFVRLGTFASITDITASMNNDVAANGTPYINYPSKSFDTTETTGSTTFTLEINGATVQDSLSANDSASFFNGIYFDLTATATGSFPSTGLPFNIFNHKQGTVRIPTNQWQKGWNYAKVYDAHGNMTNYIDWVWDDAASAVSSSYAFNNFTTASVSATGTKWLSGVPYLTGFSYNVTGSVSNYYKNTYQTASLSFSSVTSGVTAGAVSIADPVTADSELQVSSAHTLAASGRRVLGTTLASTLAITNAFSKTGNSGAITTPTILLDNTNTANTALQENFCLENYRVAAGDYNNQSDVTTALGAFPSGSTLGPEDLLVYNGGVRYITQGLNSSNFAGANIVYTTGDTLPDYSADGGDRYYYRGFQNGSNADATFNIGITGTNVNFLPYSSGLSGNGVQVWIKIPGKTGWRDISTDAPASTSGIALNDNVGARTGAQPSNLGAGGGTATFAIDLKTEGLLPSEYFVVRVLTSDAWAGSISQINITGL